jgi:hypothetical protein
MLLEKLDPTPSEDDVESALTLAREVAGNLHSFFLVNYQLPTSPKDPLRFVTKNAWEHSYTTMFGYNHLTREVEVDYHAVGSLAVIASGRLVITGSAIQAISQAYLFNNSIHVADDIVRINSGAMTVFCEGESQLTTGMGNYNKALVNALISPVVDKIRPRSFMDDYREAQNQFLDGEDFTRTAVWFLVEIDRVLRDLAEMFVDDFGDLQAEFRIAIENELFVADLSPEEPRYIEAFFQRYKSHQGIMYYLDRPLIVPKNLAMVIDQNVEAPLETLLDDLKESLERALADNR